MDKCKNCGHPIIIAGGLIYHLGKKIAQRCEICGCNDPVQEDVGDTDVNI